MAVPLQNIYAVVALFFVISAAQQAPETFVVTFNTSKGVFEVAVNRSWAPYGADRFYTLVTSQYYDGNAFFRVIDKFVAQWGINGDPATSAKWENLEIPNDPVVKSNLRGYVSYAAEMQGSKTCCRTTQLYLNYVDNSRLDQYGFSPFGFIQTGMSVADQFYNQYGEAPDQDQIYSQGNAYLKQNFPLLDYIVTATVKQ